MARRLESRLKRRRRVPRPHPDDRRGVEAEGGEAGRVGDARLDILKILPHPDERMRAIDRERHGQREAGGSRGVGLRRRVEFMQGGPPRREIREGFPRRLIGWPEGRAGVNQRGLLAETGEGAGGAVARRRFGQ